MTEVKILGFFLTFISLCGHKKKDTSWVAYNMKIENDQNNLAIVEIIDFIS